MSQDDQLDLWLGRIGDSRVRRGPHRALQSELIRRVNRAGVHRPGLREGLARTGRSPRTGRFNARGRGAIVGAQAAAASPWSVDPRTGLRLRARRVVVKARVVKLTGAKAMAKAKAHLRYLQRDGVTREGETGRLYSTFSDEADGKAFVERGEGDRHQFRFIVSPEDGGSLETLRTFTRELMARMEEDLGTSLDWIAVDHFDTGHPHAHVLLRGVTEDGKVLNIAGDYIAHGVRYRASEIMTRWLGHQTELEVRGQLAREVDAERLTQLDRSLLGRAEAGRLDLALGQEAWDKDGSWQQLLIARARRLERMELASREAPLVWRLSPDMKDVLSDLGRRGDIIRTMHLAMTSARLERRPELYAIGDGAAPEAVVGRVVASGAADDFHQRRYVVIDGVDGRTHYCEIGLSEDPAPAGSLVRLEPVSADIRKSDRVVAAVAAVSGGHYSIDLHLAQDRSATEEYARAHVRRLEALRRRAGAAERLPDGRWIIPEDYLERALEAERGKARAAPWRIRILSRLELEAQAVSDGPTWLDRQLVSDDPSEVAAFGYGEEVRRALRLRQQWLLAEGLAEAREDDVLLARDLEARLRARELGRAADRLRQELGLAHAEPRAGRTVSGVVLRKVDLGSGSYAVIEGERSFSLVPWRPVLGRRLGREVSGVVRTSGAISWSFGRSRAGPEVGG